MVRMNDGWSDEQIDVRKLGDKSDVTLPASVTHFLTKKIYEKKRNERKNSEYQTRQPLTLDSVPSLKVQETLRLPKRLWQCNFWLDGTSNGAPTGKSQQSQFERSRFWRVYRNPKKSKLIRRSPRSPYTTLQGYFHPVGSMRSHGMRDTLLVQSYS